jgi:hypothetical protein
MYKMRGLLIAERNTANTSESGRFPKFGHLELETARPSRAVATDSRAKMTLNGCFRSCNKIFRSQGRADIIDFKRRNPSLADAAPATASGGSMRKVQPARAARLLTQRRAHRLKAATFPAFGRRADGSSSLCFSAPTDPAASSLNRFVTRV